MDFGEEVSTEEGDSQRSLGGREMADHAHGDDSGVVHIREGKGHRDQIKVKDGSVSFSPEKRVCTRRRDEVLSEGGSNCSRH